MKYLLLFSTLFVVSCNSSIMQTGQDVTVNLIGTDAAYCRLSTDDNRYALDAPGTAFVERDVDALIVDCDDNNSDRRRTLKVEPHLGKGYWNYPSEVIVDFSKLDNGTRYNGFRADVSESAPVAVVVDREDRMSPVISEILTEDSYSQPVPTTQEYPVKKDYYMGRRSYPVMP